MKFKPQKNRSAAKLAFNCYGCKEAVAAKDGDWHTAPTADSQQIFLCRSCERDAKLSKSFARIY